MTTRALRNRSRSSSNSSKENKVLKTPSLATKASRSALMLGTALGCSISVFTAFKPTPVLAADVNCAPDASGSTTSGPEFCQNSGDKITYTANGDLTVVLDNVVTNTGGVQLNGSGGKYNIHVYDLFKAGFLYNNAGAGLKVTSKDGNINIDTTTGGANTTGSGTFILGSTFGIEANNFVAGGTGKIDITEGAYVSSKGTGVYARAYNGAINITSVGGNAGGTAIYAHNNSGDINVHLTNGSARGDFYNTGTGNGIRTFQNSGGTTHITVDAGTNVYGGNGAGKNTGINALSGLGPVTIDMNGTTRDGILARSNGPTGYGDATVNLGGNVYNTGGNGVTARTLNGTATINQTKGAVSASGFGLYAIGTAGSGGVSVSTSTGTSVNSTKTGIYASTLGTTGGITINAAGNVTSTTGDGISARASGGDIDITTSGVIKGDPGIVASNTGTGNVTEHINNNVYGTAGGVNVTAEAGTVDIEVGNGAHIYAQNAGAGLDGIRAVVKDGNIIINGTDAKVGITADGDGIYAETTQATAAGTAISVNWQGTIDAGKYGVNVATNDGDISVTTGAITAGASGVNAVANGADRNVTVNTGDIKAANYGVYAYATGGGGVTVTTGKVTVTGTSDGIFAYNSSGGTTGEAVSVTAGGDISTNTGNGITAINGTDNGLVSVKGAGISSGGAFGVYAQSNGNGANSVSVDLSGGVAVTGAGSDGVLARIAGGGSGSVNVKVAGSITADLTGVYASSNGTGSIVVNTADVTGTKGVGVYASSTGSAGVAVHATGLVTGGTGGIVAQTNGASYVHVYADGGATGGTGNAISATSNGGDVRVTTGGAVTATGGAATQNGIYAYTNGAGSVLIEAKGSITARDGGVVSKTINGYNDVRVYGAIIGDNNADNSGNGISVDTDSGRVNVYTSAAGAISKSYNGVVVNVHAATANGVYVTLNGDIGASGAGNAMGRDGVDVGIATAGSTGNMRVGTYGNVYATRDGINVFSASSGYTTVNTGGNVTGGRYGIYANNDGGGNVTVNATGAVTGGTSAGIGAYANSGAGSVSVTANGAVSGSTGVHATAAGSGSVSVTATNGVTGTAATAVTAYSKTGAVTVDTRGGLAHGATSGIIATNAGATGVKVYADAVTADGGIGINAQSKTGAVGVYAHGQVNATGEGVYTTTAGQIYVHAYSGVHSTGGSGIEAKSTGGASLVTVIADGAVAGDNGSGVIASNVGSGSVSVHATGGVTAGAGHGVYARTADGSVYVTTRGGAVSATGGDGVQAVSTGAGSVQVYTDAVKATGVGVNAQSGSSYVHVYTHGAVDAGATGIYARTGGAANVSVRAYGSVHAAAGNGVDAGVTASGGSVNVSTYGDINADAGNGINTVAAGTSSTSIYTGPGATITAAGDGIHGSSDGGNITVNSHSNIVADPGIYLTVGGSGVIDVYSYGTISAKNGGIVTSTVNGHNHVYVHNTVTGDSDLNNAGDGVRATSSGSGSILVQTFAGGDITGDSQHGIYAHGTAGSSESVTVIHDGNIGSSANTVSSEGIDAWITGGAASTGNVSVTGAGNIYANSSGIYAFNNGSGTVTINTTGNTTGGGDGLRAIGYGGQVSIYNSGQVYAASNGIYARHNAATGGIDITNNGNVGSSTTSVGNLGIYARNFGGGTGSVSVTGSGNVYASNGGVRTFNNGTGGTTVNIGGNVTTNGNGFNVVDNGGGVVGVTTGGTISAGSNGVYANASGGAGSLSVTTNGLVDSAGNGIVAIQSNTGGLTVTENGGISGKVGATGIRAIDYAASGNAVVHVNGSIGTSGDHVGGYGVYARIAGGGTGALTVDGNGQIWADSLGIRAFSNASGDTTVNMGGYIHAGSTGITAGNTGGGSVNVTMASGL